MATGQILPSPDPTPAASTPSSTRSRQKKSKAYKRIKFKQWKPEGAFGTHSQLRDGTHRWRIGTANTTSTPSQESSDGQDEQAVVMTRYTYKCPSPLQKLPGNGHRQDPFVTLPIEATESVTSSLDFFLATCVPENRNSEWLVGKPNPHMSMLFPFMLKNAMLFEAIMALCRASIVLSQGRKAEEDRGFVYHRTRAIKAVTANLTSTDALSDASLLSVTMILTLEYLIGNIAAVAAHLEGIQRMVDMRPDLDGSTQWKRFIKAGMVAYQSLGSFVTGQPMQIPGYSPGFIKEAFAELELDRPLSYPTVPFSPDLCMVLSRLPSGFAELCLSGNISEQTMNLLALAHATTSYREDQVDFDERLDHEVQVMLSVIQRLTLMAPTSLEQRLLCGLLGYAFQLRQLRPLNLFHDPPLRSMIKFLRAHEKPDSLRAQETMVWISIAAAGALNLRTIVMPGTAEVLDRMFQLYPATVRWSYVEPILKSHFWTTTIGEHWKKQWTTGLARWRRIEKRANSEPEVVRLNFPGEKSIEGPSPEEHESVEPISLEAISAHARGAGSSIRHMMDAASRCPFQSRLGPSLESPEKIAASLCPVSHVAVTGT